MAITTPKEFFKTVFTKTKINDDIVEKEIYVPNTYTTCLKNDIAEIYLSADGSDNNSGFSSNDPIETLDKGFQIMKDYGFSSVHFYFLTGTNFYMNDYKNVAGCSIHFHTRADNVNLHIVNNSTAEKAEYDYTAFYGNHYNFGNTRKITPGDSYNITQKMNVIFHSNVRGSYFEGCSVIFNGCRIYQNDCTTVSLSASTPSEHYLYPTTGNPKYTGFGGCSSVQFNQCFIYDEIVLDESNCQFMDCNFYVRNDVETFIYARNSKVLFRMGHTGNLGEYVARWNGASNNYYGVRFNSNLTNSSPAVFFNADSCIFALNSDIAFYDGLGIVIAGVSAGALAKIKRFITLRNSTLTASQTVVVSNNKSAIAQINLYNTSTPSTTEQNTCTCSTVNGVYYNAKTGDL